MNLAVVWIETAMVRPVDFVQRCSVLLHAPHAAQSTLKETVRAQRRHV